jgi:tetratricopeptide (TPR) repeat protein
VTGSVSGLAFGGRYQLDRELGRGGMATVYLAFDLRYDRPVAFKLLRRDVTLALDAERFRREIATAARLQHPHICSVYDSGETDGQLWYTMPYIRGESLRERLRGGGRPGARGPARPPPSPDAALWVGSAYLRLRRYDEARRELDRARGLRPASMSLGYSRARLAAAEGDLAGIRRVFQELERRAGPRAVAAYVALREDLIWALPDDQLRLVTTLTPDDLDGGRADWALAVSEAHRFLGDSARSRTYADSAVTAYDRMLERWGNRRDRGQIVVTRALALALGGRAQDARAAADEAGRLQPLGSGIQSPYIAYVRGRIAAMAGDPASAVARLRGILAVPAQQSRGWLAIDRTLAPLRGDAEFEALIRRP